MTPEESAWRSIDHGRIERQAREIEALKNALDAAERREQSLRDDYETTEGIVQAYAMALRIDPHTPKEKCVELVKALERRAAEAEGDTALLCELGRAEIKSDTDSGAVGWVEEVHERIVARGLELALAKAGK